ncbi:glutathione S-transferase-like protein [Mycena albidolilacea]|uniref:glutathione transferase n=1 Tax=Mycena albidolilacea TaxID=1033008 RepID=A0AAD7EK39_9AGAR|nr:glutathione S-transferase-like protein [Mycena albidolilacea]
MSSSDTPTITLHWLEKSRAQRILWLLEEINVPYEIKTYKRHPKTQFAPPELKAVHPLGKSPAVTIGNLAIAESALVVEYLSEHFGPSLIPTKWKAGCEGKAGGETEEYMRYRYFMHYCEGSLLPLLVVSMLSDNIRTAPVPFFIRPVTSRISGSIKTEFLDPNFDTHFTFIEEQLATSGGRYLCGDKLTGADIMMGYPILVVTSDLGDRGPANVNRERSPHMFAYAAALQATESYNKAVKKVVALEGEYVLI